jgi:adenylate cyclase
MPKRKTKARIKAVLAVTVSVTLIIGGLVMWNPLEKWQYKLTNSLYDRNEASSDIVIVGIDEDSLNSELGRWQSWNRTYYSQILGNLSEADPKVIAFDIMFTERSTGISEDNLSEIISDEPTYEEYFSETIQFMGKDHPDDLKLAEVFESIENIIILVSSNFTNDLVTTDIVENLELFEGTVHEAVSDYYWDSDDLARRVPIGLEDKSTGDEYFALSAAIAKMVNGSLPESLYEVLDENNQMLINYAAPPYSYEIIPFIDVYTGKFDEAAIKDKIVLIGVTTDLISDHVQTPTSYDTPMPGVEFHANALQTILEENFLVEQSKISQLIVIFFLTLSIALAVMILGVFSGFFTLITSIVIYFFSAQPLFNTGIIINLVYPILALFAAYLVTTLYKYLTETKEKNELRGAFSKYVNKDLVNKIMENPEMLKLGGEKRTVTVFFSDIASFTTFSEQCTPEELVTQLNEYFEVMAGIIRNNGGTLNKFDGDAIMAFWGAPLDEPNHATLAAQSALECRLALPGLHAKWGGEGKPLLDFRVGLATGDVIAGNVGSQDRFDYTVMGDIVNLGSRLEGANKQYGTHVMISDAVLAIIAEQFEVRRLDKLRVKGKELPVDVFELIAAKGQIPEEALSVVGEFHQAIEYYRNQKFEEAQTRFETILVKHPNDGPTKVYIERCVHFKQNPPVDGWDGTWVMDHK